MGRELKKGKPQNSKQHAYEEKKIVQSSDRVLNEMLDYYSLLERKRESERGREREREVTQQGWGVVPHHDTTTKQSRTHLTDNDDDERGRVAFE